MAVSNAALMIKHMQQSFLNWKWACIIMSAIILKSRGCFHPKQQIPEQFQEQPTLGLSAPDGHPISTLRMNTLGAYASKNVTPAIWWLKFGKVIDAGSPILAYKKKQKKNSTAKEVIQAALKRGWVGLGEMEHGKIMVEEDKQTTESGRSANEKLGGWNE